jgi:hypothetical protein
LLLAASNSLQRLAQDSLRLIAEFPGVGDALLGSFQKLWERRTTPNDPFSLPFLKRDRLGRVVD